MKQISQLTPKNTVESTDQFVIDDSNNNTRKVTASTITKYISVQHKTVTKKLLFGSTKLGEEVKKSGNCTANTSWMSNTSTAQTLSNNNTYNWTVKAESTDTTYYKNGGLRWYFQLTDDWTKYDELLVIFAHDTLNYQIQYAKLDVNILTSIATDMKNAYPYSTYGSNYIYRRSINLYNSSSRKWVIELVASHITKNRMYSVNEDSYLHAIYGLKYGI